MLEQIIPSLTPEDIKTLEDLCTPHKAARGEILMGEGGVKRDLYFVLSGKVKAYQCAMLADKTCALELAAIEAPLLLGEINLFMDAGHAATVVSVAECDCLVLSHENIQKLETQHPQLFIKLLRFAGDVVAKRLVDKQNNLHGALVSNATDYHHALANLRKYVGDIKMCPPDLAEKLFNIQQPS